LKFRHAVLSLEALGNGGLTLETLRNVGVWAARLEAEVARVQIRAMRTKWASCSSRGTLTVNRDLLDLEDGLIAYVLVHELLHLRFPGHGKGWQAMMGAYVPDGQEREAVLARFVVDGER
jgi:predicted metal-dependent hydrolase